MVKLRIYGILRVLARRDEIEVDAKDVREACEKLSEMLGGEAKNLIFDKTGNIYSSILIFKDDERITDLNVHVEHDTILHVIPAVEGGIHDFYEHAEICLGRSRLVTFYSSSSFLNRKPDILFEKYW